MKKNYLVLGLFLFILFSMGSVHSCDVYIDSCQTLSSANTRYCLNQSISNSSDCFSVTANNITLDCQGNSIVSTSYQANEGIRLRANTTTIKNCHLMDWWTGISYRNDPPIYGLDIYNNLFSSLNGIRWNSTEVDNSTVWNNTFFNETFIGFYFDGGYHYNNYIYDNQFNTKYFGFRGDSWGDNNTFVNNNLTVTTDGYYPLYMGRGRVYYLNNTINNWYVGDLTDNDNLYNIFENNTIKGTFRLGGNYEIIRGGHVNIYRLGTENNNGYFWNTNLTDEPFRSVTMDGDNNSSKFYYKSYDNWLNTTVDTAQTFNRRLYETNSSYVRWFDDGTGNFYYTLGGLNPNSKYKIYDNTSEIYLLDSDLNGALPTFKISLSSGHEIIAQQVTTYIEITFNYSSVSFGLLSQGSINNTISGKYNVTVSASDPYKISVRGSNFSDGILGSPININMDASTYCKADGTIVQDDPDSWQSSYVTTDTSTVGQKRGFTKWDISSIPKPNTTVDIVFDKADLCYMLEQDGAYPLIQEGYVGVFGFNNKTWSSLTWNENPQYNTTWMDRKNTTGLEQTHICWDVRNQIEIDLPDSSGNTSFVFNYTSPTPPNHVSEFYSSSLQLFRRPYLNITYRIKELNYFGISNLRVDMNESVDNISLSNSIPILETDVVLKNNIPNSVTGNFYSYWLSIPAYQYASLYTSILTYTYELV